VNELVFELGVTVPDLEHGLDWVDMGISRAALLR